MHIILTCSHGSHLLRATVMFLTVISHVCAINHAKAAWLDFLPNTCQTSVKEAAALHDGERNRFAFCAMFWLFLLRIVHKHECNCL